MFAKDTRVLVVDDMMTMRKLVMKALKDLGFEDFTEAQNGAQAWDVFSKSPKPIQLIISDFNMPVASGLDFLKRVREDDKYDKVPFILLTAESEVSVVTEAISLGASGYIVKPFTVADLSNQLSKAASRMK